jgi:hypothetical protein
MESAPRAPPPPNTLHQGPYHGADDLVSGSGPQLAPSGSGGATPWPNRRSSESPHRKPGPGTPTRPSLHGLLNHAGNFDRSIRVLAPRQR